MNKLVAETIGGTVLGIGAAKGISKLKHKPVGMPGTGHHVLTNDKIDKKGKASCFLNQAKEGVKDVFVLGGITSGAMGTAAVATGTSNTIAQKFQNLISKTGQALGKVAINGKNLKEIIKETSIYNKINSLTLPAKAAIAAGTITLAIIAPIIQTNSVAKAAYIEGQHEVK